MDEKRLTGLDFMRALACVLVLLTHLFQKLKYGWLRGGWEWAYDVFILGSVGVGIFFMLSGFLLSGPFWRAFDGGAPLPSLRNYALRRAGRIVPGYYAALAITFVLSVTVFAFPLTCELVFRLISGFGFFSEFHPVTWFPVEVNQPLWSIGVEVFSYALLPFCFMAVFALRGDLPAWSGRLSFLAVIALAIVGHYLIRNYVPQIEQGRGWQNGAVGGAKDWMPRFNPMAFFVFFAMGALASGLSTLWRGSRHVVADGISLIGVFGALYLLLPGASRPAPEVWGWFDLPYAFPTFPLLIGLALLALPHAKYLPKLTELAAIRFVARISFGIYIWHMLWIELVRQFVEPQFAYGGLTDLGRWSAMAALVTTLTVTTATASWYLIERPALNWAKTLERRQDSASWSSRTA